MARVVSDSQKREDGGSIEANWLAGGERGQERERVDVEFGMSNVGG